MYQSYNDFIGYLKSLQDLDYKKFQNKLTFSKYEMIGIRVPILRKIAKDIVKNDYKKFLEEVEHKYYEEVFIEGLVIASLSHEEMFKFLPQYIERIDDWAICDSFCNSLKIINNNLDKYFNYFKEYLQSNKEFVVRMVLVIFLNFYVSNEYIEKIFKLIDKIDLDKYYVNMAIAWLLCECYIKYPDKTLEFLKRTNINDFTFNKTISKINDSYRVSEEVKNKLKKMRR